VIDHHITVVNSQHPTSAETSDTRRHSYNSYLFQSPVILSTSSTIRQPTRMKTKQNALRKKATVALKRQEARSALPSAAVAPTARIGKKKNH